MFKGSNLRLARLYNELSLEQVAERVGKTRQYIQRLETDDASPTPELTHELAKTLQVNADFLSENIDILVNEELVHFRKRNSTRMSTKLAALSRAELYRRLINIFDEYLSLPPVKFPSIKVVTQEDIEKAAEKCRIDWQLGMGPIENMTRLAEKLGAFVTSFESISDEVDTFSVPLKRPFIVRNRAKRSPCRQRFDIAHEIAHLILHVGISTGDRISESQANRFASALLLPRSSMAKYFPKPIAGRIDWKGLSQFKLTWKASKAAIIYRAHQLSLLTDSQYTTAFLGLKRKGEAVNEKEDMLIDHEESEFFHKAMSMLIVNLGIKPQDLAKQINISEYMLADLAGDRLLSDSLLFPQSENIISFAKYKLAMA